MSHPQVAVTPRNINNLKNGAQKDHITDFQDALKNAFQEVVEREVSDPVKAYFGFIQQAKSIPTQERREAALQGIYSELKNNKAVLAAVLELDAKQQDVLRRARKAGVNNIVSDYKETHRDQSFSLAAELQKCAEAGMSASEVQKYMDQHFRAIFSLTGHPTNPTTLAYTKAGYALDAVIDQNSRTSEDDLNFALAAIIAAPMSGPKKTPQEEMQETNEALRNIAVSQKRLRLKLEDVIANSPYSGELRVPEIIAETSVWTHGGDADGNPNMTADVLRQGYQLLQREHFDDVTIDIRHDSGDIMEAANAVMEQLGVENFKDKSEEEQAAILKQKLAAGIPAINADAIQDKTAKEIVKRLTVCSEFPGKTNKLIIANTEGAHHALAALFLLKTTGNKVAEPGATIDIVTLSESVEDLKKIHDVQKELLADEVYREHLRHRGRIVQMTAKSDTTRVGGSGVEYYQDRAGGEAALLAKIAEEEYGLSGLEVRSFSGGGAALQRGGGRPDEAANRQARALMAIAVETGWQNPRRGPTIVTLQGHQQNLTCSAGEVVDNTIEDFAAQDLHAALLVEDRLQSKTVPGAGEAERKEFCDIAIANYQEKYFGNRAINELFANGNRAGVLLGNLSSRPAKRGGTNAPVPEGISFKELSGDRKNFDIFATRAITLDRNGAHSGTFAVMFLGLKEAFEKYPGNLSEVYEHSKGFRDFIRNQATGLYMVDLDHSWKMMVGQERPSKEEVKALAQNFGKVGEISDEKQRLKVTMAYLDDYINEVGKQVYQIVTKEQAPENLELKNVLRRYSPELARSMDYREKEAAFAKMVERETIAYYNAHENEALSKDDLNVLRASYNGSDIASNSPVAMLEILTSRDKTQSHVKALESETSTTNLPNCLRRFGSQQSAKSSHSI